jgi:fluoroacetyl-CoA thioesterase
MELPESIYPGLSREQTFTVDPENTAYHLGSGASRVLATPWMIAFMERTAHALLTCCLPQGTSSVGTHLDVRHLAPTPQGGQVRIRAEVLSIDGLKVIFALEAWDALEKVGEGRHERSVIDEARFLRRVDKKIIALQDK